MTIARNKTLKRNVHYCGGGFKGDIIKANGIKFCGFCGKEFKS